MKNVPKEKWWEEVYRHPNRYVGILRRQGNILAFEEAAEFIDQFSRAESPKKPSATCREVIEVHADKISELICLNRSERLARCEMKFRHIAAFLEHFEEKACTNET